jgi:hypothetical protein
MPDFGIFRGFNDKLFGDKLYAGQLPTELGLIGSFDFDLKLLDFYPNAAAAYSLRKLRNAYTGSAIEVRRTNLDVADIGFTSTGELDISALLAFTGTGALDNGFVTKWYDQSGNGRNATQTLALNQPQIVSSGSVLILGTKPCMRFDGINDSFNLSSNINVSTGDKFSSFQIEKKTTSNSLGIWITPPSGSNPFTLVHYSNQICYFDVKLNATTADVRNFNLAGNNYNLFSTYALDSTSLSLAYVNNSLATLDVGSFAESRTTSFARIGNRNVNEWSNTSTQELILYLSDESANNTAINTNINTYYGIY